MNLKNTDNGISALEEIEMNIGDLLSEMPGGFFVYHADGDEGLIYANDACFRIFGCETLEQFKELTGFTFPGMVHKDDIDDIEASIAEQIANDIYNMDNVEYRIVTYDGSVRWVEDFGHYVQLESGSYFYVFINDATDKLLARMEELERINAQLNEAYSREKEHRRLLYVALQQANTANIAKTTFLNNMSHDIRTLLNAVTGYSLLISDHLDDANRIERYAHKINDASAQLLDVVAETLEVSRYEAGRMQLVEDDCSLKKIAQGVKERYLPKAIKKEIDFCCDYSTIVHDEVFTDEQRIKQIMEQLVDNAVKYTPAGGSVELRLEELDARTDDYGRYRISITDSGDGMHQEFVEHMFDPFARELNTTQSGIAGTGLGLTIVKHSVDLLSGSLDVDTEDGKGTSISITFSAKYSVLPEKPALTLPESLALEDLSVLLVEDNELNREIATCMLQDNGVKVSCAVDGREAVEAIRNSKPGDIDIVLMDLQLPLMNGYEAAQAIRALDDELLANIPIIAVTSDAFPEDRKRVLSAGMNAHIAKPLIIDNLREAINELV
ncbi:MAG: response regulator [Eggerthellaceae bacterium]|nr:response regulator [Eggerthellaceae bacterium]